MTENVKRLYRSRNERMIAGICGGLGEYFSIDPTLVRLIFVFGTIITGTGLFWAYLIMLLVVPEEPFASETVVDAPVEAVEESETE
jgi:phage shock protein C